MTWFISLTQTIGSLEENNLLSQQSALTHKIKWVSHFTQVGQRQHKNKELIPMNF